MVASRLTLINRDSLFGSLLAQWFLKNDHSVDAESNIVNAIRNANLAGISRRSYIQLELEVKQLKADLELLFVFIASTTNKPASQNAADVARPTVL